MGAKKEGAGGEKKDDAKVSVYNISMHCEGCARTVKDVIKHIDGVEDVKIDCAGNKLTVTGKVDPAKVKERLEKNTKKKVEIVSPQPTKDGGRAGKKAADKKPAAEEEKKPPKEEKFEMKLKKHTDEAASKVAEQNVQLNARLADLEEQHMSLVCSLSDQVSVLKEMLSNAEKRARDEVHHLSESVYHLQREWAQAKKELQQERDNVTSLRSECKQTKKNAKRQVEEKEKELANALHAVQAAETRAAAAETRAAVAEACPICLTNGKDLAFNCGHMTCQDCGSRVSNCPMCRRPITNRLRLFYSMKT